MSKLRHHPNCMFWYDNYPTDCTCGLTEKAIAGLHPFTEEQWEIWKLEAIERIKSSLQ